MRSLTFVLTAVLFSVTSALPHFGKSGRDLVSRLAKCNDGVQEPRLFVLPPQIPNTASKKIPDADHPFIPPGPNDLRGPCPMLNTLANHGYINRSGVDTGENLIKAVMEAVNMERNFASAFISLGILTRGNSNIAKLSIGGPSVDVPPLPGCIDGPAPGGLSTHGRFEGDVSMTRLDNGLGSTSSFNQTGFNRFLEFVSKYGDDGLEGPNTLVNVETMANLKFAVFNEDKQLDNQFYYQSDRQLSSYAEAALVLELMQDGRTNRTSVNQLKYFFEQETFGPDFYRRGSPADVYVIAPTATAIMNGHPVPYGANAPNGTYITDVPPNPNFPCDGFKALVTKQVPGVLLKTTGIFRQNVDTMVQAMHQPFVEFASCEMSLPGGPAGT